MAGNAVLPAVLPDRLERERSVVEKIPPYKIILLDDNITTMEFVVQILIQIFRKDPDTAGRLMREVHTQGAAHVATLSREQAELKQEQVHVQARAKGFPFRCAIEPA